MYATIANRQVNLDFIFGAEGVQQNQTGKIRLYVDSKLSSFVGGAGEGVHMASAGSLDQPAIIELTGAEAGKFREQWQKLLGQQTQSAAG